MYISQICTSLTRDLILFTASFCTDPGVPPFGGRNPPPTKAGKKYSVGDTIQLTCNPGFVHLGSSSRNCLPTGKWSGSNTYCKGTMTFAILHYG